MSEKMPSRLLTSVVLLVALVVALSMALYPFYGTVTWFIDPPPKLYIAGTGYALESSTPAATSLPPTVAWIADRHMWPLWYDIFTPRDGAGPSVFLRWRDGLYYAYTTRG
jgi:hypothetical protein